MATDERSPASPDGAGRLRRAIFAAGVVWLVGALWGLSVEPGTVRRLVANLTAVVLFGLLAAGAFPRARSERTRALGHDLSWRLGGWAGVAGAVGGLAFAFGPMLPSAEGWVGPLARIASILPPLLVAVALMVARPPTQEASRPWVSALDGAIFAGACFLFLWLVGFRELASALEPALDAVAVLTPFVGSALVLGVVAYHAVGSEIPPLAPVGLVAIWAALGLLFEAAFAFEYAVGRWHAGHWIEMVGLARMVPLAAAPFATEQARARTGPRAVPGDLLVYVPTGAALVASVLLGIRGTLVYDAVTVTLFLAVGFAILVRQFVALQTVRTLSRTLERRVEERTAALVHAQRSMEQSQRLEAIGRLAGGVAHDFNNLLAAIGAHAELLREDLPDDSELQEDVEAIEKAAQRGSALTRQLLTFARRQPGVPQPHDLAPLVRETTSFLRRVVPAGVVIDVSLEDGTGAVRIDPSHVDQLVTNLVVNAQEAVGDTGNVAIRLDPGAVDAEEAEWHGVEPGRFVHLSVSDDGSGIPEEIVDRIFEPFFTTRPGGRGTGLGLATCYGIVTGAGGFVTVDTEVGRGSTFHCWFPVEAEAGSDDTGL